MYNKLEKSRFAVSKSSALDSMDASYSFGLNGLSTESSQSDPIDEDRRLKDRCMFDKWMQNFKFGSYANREEQSKTSTRYSFFGRFSFLSRIHSTESCRYRILNSIVGRESIESQMRNVVDVERCEIRIM